MYLTKLSTEKLGGTITLSTTSDEYTEFKVLLPPDLRHVIKERDELEQRLQVEKILMSQNKVGAIPKSL